MDISEYLPMFLAEAREHLQELNLAVIRIEDHPDDRATVDEIFRIAHSFKGMSATMGFEQTAALTHEMENVFELLRERQGGLGRDAVDVLFCCLDALDGAVTAVEADGQEQLDAAPLIARLKGLVRQRDDDEAEPAVEAEEPKARGDVVVEGPVLHVRIELDPETPMPSVRAYQALAALADHGRILRSAPAEADLEGFAGTRLEAWLASDHETEAIAATAAAVAGVASAEVVEDDAPAAQAQAPVASIGGHKAAPTVRVDAERLDQLMHLMGELVVHRTHVESLAGEGDLPALHSALQDLTRSSQALQAMVMQVRMIPVDAVFTRLPRLVRDLSSKLGKHVELVLTGKDTELDRSVVEELGDPLVHLVRNALDHGLETPAERLAAGKPETATLEIAAAHIGGNVVIAVRDDGRGIDPGRVAAKAVAQGLIPASEAASIDVPRAVELLFHPGFSTADRMTDISGRGVGMDAVRTSIRGLGGDVVVQSETGVGTTASIRLPLTLAITTALLVEAGGMPFALPLDRVERTLRLSEHAVRTVVGSPTLLLRDATLPLIDLAHALGHAPAGEAGYAVVVRSGERRLALAVESLIGQRELVTRPLPPELGDRATLSGGALLSNGQIALVVDCDAVGTVEARPIPSVTTLAA